MKSHARRAAAPRALQAAAANPVRSGEDVPFALRVSAAWAWRLGIVLIVGAGLIWVLSHFSLLIIPLMIAALLAGLLSPVSNWLRRNRLPGGLSVAVTLLAFLGLITAALTLVGRQLALGFQDLWGETMAGVRQIQDWLSSGPLHISTDQIDSLFSEASDTLQENSGSIVSGALSVGSSAGHFAAGVLLTIFALIFFLLDGPRIWRFTAGLLPRRARPAAYGAGIQGWDSMVNYVRVQVVVALIDAVGIGGLAALIGVPLALPLTVLVFLGSFVPLVGAFVTGFVAVLLALVANGWVNALVMLGIVLLVQQVESHILQPLVMGRAVSLHPLAVILAVTGGTLAAGIPGALFSVPLLAILNAVVRYIAARHWENDPAVEEQFGAGPHSGPDLHGNDPGDGAAGDGNSGTGGKTPGAGSDESDHEHNPERAFVPKEEH
ncbi:AI-2E family transporter [Arthrobacter sp. zg-Y40]|uniref:AI-2E family transporter n=1 Tax=unclassified Arthrobacter TaxID=235627 RepID=UPI001D13F708|nr:MULTISPECIES: AI-2E family transporter [unclassified Arthrobacter]MCC3277168.1 AI-2E family transporter [Arthrobacter sp. zg-Y20]MCC3280110.1 AI-2E family transporter [Arthrobacter sp. zg-Y40]MDK1317329.1 AI-2E family transporter [Arthrobacter sp. zg.Y20]MDK1328538.1 AI-2E family transporter [Arthrobacter sp. zg-Y1143]WIB07108.1 AI-2E family transporter [Arthrobacter sp. zg-Y20]